MRELKQSRRPSRAAAALVLLACAGTWALLPPARAAMLEAEQCDKLKAEEAELTKAGVRGHLTRGPEWARTNLGADGVERVRRLIAVDEQIAFRCPRPPPPKPAVAEGAGAAAAGKKSSAKGAKTDAKSAAAADATTEAKQKPKPKSKAATAEQQGAAKANPKPKPKPSNADEQAPAKSASKPPAPKVARPKAEDAYSPTNPTPK